MISAPTATPREKRRTSASRETLTVTTTGRAQYEVLYPRHHPPSDLAQSRSIPIIWDMTTIAFTKRLRHQRITLIIRMWNFAYGYPI